MALKRRIKKQANTLLQMFGKQIVDTQALYEWQRTDGSRPPQINRSLPDAALEYLKPDNPRLIALQQRYSVCDPDVITPSLWEDSLVSAEDIACFRGDNAWVWQLQGMGTNILSYALSFYYLKSMDRLGLFEKLGEDENFGNLSFPIGDRLVSRDLMDSIAEICFLDRHLQIGSRKGLRILDIGAGYGRLAHRMVSALDGVESYYCTDAVAISTFVSEYYLRFRGVNKAVVVPLDEISATLRATPIDLAINVHSFAECRSQAIEWWIRLLSQHRVKSLLIVSDYASDKGERLLNREGIDFLPILARYGYRTAVQQPKYLDPVVQQFGVQPALHRLLEHHP